MRTNKLTQSSQLNYQHDRSSSYIARAYFGMVSGPAPNGYK